MKPSMPPRHSTPARQGGFTLIEILVAAIILSIGMLGIAGLQVATDSYKMNSSALNASALLVSNLADRIRANPSEAGNAYGTATKTSSYLLGATWEEQKTPPNINKDCLQESCTPTEKATYDMNIWRRQVREVLPRGSAWVEGSVATGINVTLMWADKNQVGSGDTLVKAPECSSSTAAGAAEVNCCPSDAEVDVGVRCLRFSFIP